MDVTVEVPTSRYYLNNVLSELPEDDLLSRQKHKRHRVSWEPSLHIVHPRLDF